MNARALAAGAAFAALAAPAPASAKTVACKMGEYGSAPAMAVSKLRAVDLPAKTDGYAPRCLVAETIAYIAGDRPEDLPASVHPYGARWDGGTWICSYRLRSRDSLDGYVEWQEAKCHRKGKPSRKVTFTLGA